MSVDHIDPWPDQIIKKDHGPGEGILMKKTHAIDVIVIVLMTAISQSLHCV